MRGMSVASRPSPMMFTLPKPSDGFEWVQLPAGPALVCRPLEPYASHLFTTRPWRLGVSSTATDADAWHEVAAAMAVDIPRLARLRQVHGAAVVTYRSRNVHFLWTAFCHTPTSSSATRPASRSRFKPPTACLSS